MTAGTPAAADGSDDAGGSGVLVHAANSAAVAIIAPSRTGATAPIDRPETVVATQGNAMSLLLLEALGALLLFVFMVWWTMFSGRKKGEMQDDSPPPAPGAQEEAKKEADKK
jgi:cbb3-type cytochrome oxidase subunit 3